MLSMVFTIVLISSCTVLKQQDFTQHRYLNGAKHHKSIAFTDQFIPKKKIEKVAHITPYVSPNNLDELEPLAMAIHSEKTIETVQLSSIPTLKDSLKTKNFGCDKITLKNGKVEFIKVIEVTDREIKYKRCKSGIIRGVTFVVKKSDNFVIEYAGSEKDADNLEEEQEYYKNESSKHSTNQSKLNQEEKKSINTGVIILISIGIIFLLLLTGYGLLDVFNFLFQ